MGRGHQWWIHHGVSDHSVVEQMKLSQKIMAAVSGRVAALAVTLSSLAFWLVVLTFPDFFLFNPLDSAQTIFQIEQTFSTAGWILIATVPALTCWFDRVNQRSTESLYVFSLSLWPISIFVIQLTMATQGFGFYSYISSFPILAFTDILFPMFLLLIRGEVFGRRTGNEI